MASTIAFDFFQLEVPAGAMSIDAILAKVLALPAESKLRMREVGDKTIRVQELAREGSMWAGNLTRIRMDGLPFITKTTTGATKPIPLEKEEGLGEETAFAYHPATKVLLIQRNKFGVTQRAFCSYMEKVGGISDQIDIAPVPRPDALQRLAGAELRKVRLKLAHIANPQLLVGTNATVQQSVELLTGTAPFIEITMSCGPGRSKGLPASMIEAVESFVQMWSNDSGPEVDALRVQGKDKDGDPLDLDLLEFRLHHVAPVDDTARQLPYATRLTHMRAAWKANRAMLRQIVGG